ncbi:MAG: CvpA family protein [Maribacter sp.]
MSFLDIVLGLMLIWGLWKGLKNGLFVEIASIIALISGIYGAIHFSYITGNYLSDQMEWNEKYISITAFIITFILIVLIVHIAGKFLTKIADFAMLGLLNKIAGGAFGILKVAVILGALLVFFERLTSDFSFLDQDVTNRSELYQPIKKIGAFVFDSVLESGSVTNNNP